MTLPINYWFKRSILTLSLYPAITYIAMDRKLGCLDNDLKPDSEAQQIVKAVHTIFDCLFWLDVQPSLWKIMPTPTYLRMKRTMNWFYGYAPTR